MDAAVKREDLAQAMESKKPKYLFHCLEEVRQYLADAERVVLFLDFDGTLGALAPRPSLAKLEPGTRNLLQSPADDTRIVAIVSGRVLSDLEKRIVLPNLIYAGNHGFEIKGPALDFVHSEAMKALPLIEKACRR
jgi:trehalose-phosphatase